MADAPTCKTEERSMTAREHAFDFTLPVDPRAAIRRIGKRILEMAESDPNLAAKLDTIQQKLGDGRPVVGNEHSNLFERIKCTRDIPDIPTAPEWARPLITIAYLRAKAAIATGNITNVIGNLDKTLNKILKLLETVEPDFMGELLTETTLAARGDRQFARTLHEGAAEYRELVNELYGLNGETTGTATKAAAAGSRGSCTCCRTVDGRRHCGPCSCWIIVIIIIIIIVTK